MPAAIELREVTKDYRSGPLGLGRLRALDRASLAASRATTRTCDASPSVATARTSSFPSVEAVTVRGPFVSER